MSKPGWSRFFEFMSNSMPAIGEFIGFLADLPDKEWEDISSAWPSPIKSKMALVRAEAKARKHFFGEE